MPFLAMGQENRFGFKCVAGDKAKLVIRDEGLGIAEENQERIFQRFERTV